MLVLSRKPGQKVILGNITVTLLGVQGNRARVGLEAPESVAILRGELASWQHEQLAEHTDSVTRSAEPVSDAARGNGSARAKY